MRKCSIYSYIEKSFQIDEVSPSNNNSLIQNSNNGINSRNNNNLYKTNNNKIAEVSHYLYSI